MRVRRELVALVAKFGVNHPKVYEVSECLDQLILEWYRLKGIRQISSNQKGEQPSKTVYRINRETDHLHESFMSVSYG